MRNPTQIGILILVTGYTAVSGSIVFLTATLLGYLVSNVFFKKYESILHREYGAEYTQYKDNVPKIL
jgi:protein-S-isoprenylcysteine O-methyltransferase Ste14